MPEALTTADAARLVDNAAPERVLVHGSAPGTGRDLDLLARPAGEATLAEALRRAGFEQAGHRFVRFRCGTAEQVELDPAAGLVLPPEELEDLFALAVPLAGYTWLCRPSPEHTLLIVARRVVEGVGHLDERRRAYVDWAIEQDRQAWQHAEARADAWHAARSLELLQRLNGRAFVPTGVRARIIDDRLRRSGHTAMHAHAEVVRQLAPRFRRPAVVALSGLDGSGKSTQARLLVDTLERIGIPGAVEWAKLGEDRRLWAIRRFGTRLLSPLARAESTPAPAGEPAVGKQIRQASGTVSTVWATIACASSIWTYRRQVARYRGRAEILVYDRYILDAAVHLRWRYGARGASASRLTRALVALAPTPLAAYYLELPADAAQQRKLEDRVQDLADHATLYRKQLASAAGAGVKVLDAAQPIDALAASIARDVWRAMPIRPRRWTRARRLAWQMVGNPG